MYALYTCHVCLIHLFKSLYISVQLYTSPYNSIRHMGDITNFKMTKTHRVCVYVHVYAKLCNTHKYATSSKGKQWGKTGLPQHVVAPHSFHHMSLSEAFGVYIYIYVCIYIYMKYIIHSISILYIVYLYCV